MKNNQKGFAPLILLVLIAMVAVGGGAYYYSQNKKTDNNTTINNSGNDPKNTEESVANDPDWKMYSSSRTAITFKYPSQWTIEREVATFSVDEVDFNSLSTDVRVNVRRMPLSMMKQMDKTFTTFENYITKEWNKAEGKYNIANYTKEINGTKYFILKNGMGNPSMTSGQSQVISVMKEEGDNVFMVTGYYKVGLNVDDVFLTIAKSMKYTPSNLKGTTSIKNNSQPTTPDPVEASIELRSILSNIRPLAELSYEKNHGYAQICSANQINTSSDVQIKAVADNLMLKKHASSQAGAGIQCLSNQKSFAVSITLDTKSTWCVDSMGTTKVGTIDRNTISCK